MVAHCNSPYPTEIDWYKTQCNVCVTFVSRYNEGPYNTTWIKEVKQALTDAGLGHVLTIATDDCCGSQVWRARWNIPSVNCQQRLKLPFQPFAQCMSVPSII